MAAAGPSGRHPATGNGSGLDQAVEIPARFRRRKNAVYRTESARRGGVCGDSELLGGAAAIVIARASFVFLAAVAFADPPAPVLDVLRQASEAISGADPAAFMDQFDKSTKDYDKLRVEVEELVASGAEIVSTIDVIADHGDDETRDIQLDWLLRVDNQTPRRQVVMCRFERKGKKWKITALEPVEFFKK